MPEFIMNNAPTIITGAVTATVIGLAIAKLISNKKKGRSSCGGCDRCGKGCDENDDIGRTEKE